MKRTYSGAVNENGGTFGIVFLDFPGCVSAGDTLDEVLAMGAEALQFHVDGILDEGGVIAEPSDHDLAAVRAWLDEDGEPSGDNWLGMYPIEVTITSRPASVTVAVDRDIVQEIAELASLQAPALRGLDTLSTRDFIERATRRELERMKKSA